MERSTSVEQWTIEKLLDLIKNSEKQQEKEWVEIPKFQRNLVWKDKQNEKFIDSIKKGYPFGSLLIFKNNFTNNNEIKTKFLLIDGLQRTNALKDYCKNPYKYIEVDDISKKYDKEISDGIDMINELCRKQIKKEDLIQFIVEWIKGQKFSSTYCCYENLADNIIHKFELGIEINDEKYKKIKGENSQLRKFFDNYKNSVDIKQKSIPILIFQGDIGALPEIFSRINQQGTKLNKYQVFSSIWQQYYDEIEIKNENIRNKIVARYTELINQGYKIDGEINAKNLEVLYSYFEYIYGLGRVIIEEYQLLFKNSKEKDSIGFNIVAACLLKDINNMKSLPDKLSQLDLEEFEKKLFEAINIVKDSINPYITLKVNTKCKKRVIYHAEMHIIALIAKAYNLIDDEKCETYKNNIKYYYLYDIISNKWKGSGDSELRKVLSNSSSRYNNTINEQDWNNTLLVWFNSQLEENCEKRQKISKDKLLFLNYINTHISTHYEQTNNIEFQADHIVPVATLKKMEKGPLNCVANFGLITSKLNNYKQNKTIYEYYDTMVSKIELQVKEDKINKDSKVFKTYLERDPELQDIENIDQLKDVIDTKLTALGDKLFIKKEDFEFLKKINEDTSQQIKENYICFLNNRFTLMKNYFLDTLKVS